ncbi:putative signal transducing protein [Thermoflexus sp.]|uniref:putative signal transducing protein n=1 Tax=Thermoflexus sp. TaxID=1969742 RepID=UPI0035E439A2
MRSRDWLLVYEAGSLIEGQMIQARLEQEGIPARLRYEAIHTLIAPAFYRVEVLVPKDRAEQARQILSGEDLPSASGPEA